MEGEIDLAFFRNKKEKKDREKTIETAENARINDKGVENEVSAAIAKRRSKEALNNSEELERKKQADYEISREVGDKNLDNLFNGDLEEDMFSFSQDIEKDITEDSVNHKEENMFDPDEIFNGGIPGDSSVLDDNSSELDDSFRNLYSIEDAADSSDKKNEDLNDSVVNTKDISESSTEEDVVEEDNLIEKVSTLASENDFAGEKDIFMAMQVFDSVDGDYNLDKVDDQLVFDTDDESLLSLGNCKKDSSTDNSDKFNVDDFILDSSEI